MKLYGVPISTLRKAVRDVSDKNYEGNITFKRVVEVVGRRSYRVDFTLTVCQSSKPGGRRSSGGRRIAAACWHAHRDVMTEIFRLFPSAKIITAMATYDGVRDYLDNFALTRLTNIGSQASQLDMREARDCRHRAHRDRDNHVEGRVGVEPKTPGSCQMWRAWY